MTAQFDIGANDVEGYDAIVGQAAWLGLRLRHWPLLFLVHAERLALNQSKTYADLERRPCCVEENEMSYHIEINEYQRRLIMKALTSTDVNQFSQAPITAFVSRDRPEMFSIAIGCCWRFLFFPHLPDSTTPRNVSWSALCRLLDLSIEDGRQGQTTAIE